MTVRSETTVASTRGRIVIHEWSGGSPRYVVLIARSFFDRALER